jgi:Cellulase (glycosyl hydrolase family 5)
MLVRLLGRLNAVRAVAVAALLAGSLGGTALVVANPVAAHAATNSFKGVNWADQRDNFVNGQLVLSGLSATDSYATVVSKSNGIIAGFQSTLGANTVRLPVNPPTVTSYWTAYKGAIDSALSHGMKVILSYWESSTSEDGLIDNTATWNTMWDTVVAAYVGNSNVYFEPMNEPHGYSLTDWVNVCSGWLSRHSNVPRSRVFISGTGYNGNVTGVGASSALTGTMLSLHDYGFWHTSWTTESQWVNDLNADLGSYGSRTVIDEAGAPMTTGINYLTNHNNGNFQSYFAGVTDTARTDGIGIVYWPGLRTGDTYTITQQSGSGLAITNQSGVTQLRWGWGL